ncbi:MAG: hypothetical protein IJB52_13720 [Clostridia bacterium]|nr:hypothetical protein [Clostridia bacterium]
MKKWMTLLLAAAMLTGMTSCGGTAAETDAETADTAAAENTETAEETVDPAEADELPTDVTYDGYTFTVLSHDHPDTAIAWKVADIYTEELNGERINDAVFERNLAMTDRFGVKIAQNLQEKPSTIADQLISAGDDAFDLLQTNTQDQCSFVVKGYLMDMAQMDYINFDKAWWDSTAIDGITIGDKVYYAIGDSMLNGKKATWVVLFNKMLTGNAGVPDLYSLVKEGGWTLDKLNRFGEQIHQDVDGDGVMTWGTDIYGIGLQHEVVLPLLLGDGSKLIEMNADGSYNYNMNSPAIVDAMEQIWNFLHGGMHILNCNDYDGKLNNQWSDFHTLFMSDQIGFFMGHLGTVTLVGGDMNSDFGVLPFPKLDEAQAEYYSTFQYNNAHAVSVPKTAGDLTRTGLLTEAYEMFSHFTVLPAYYDYTLTFRSARDTDSGEMLDIIFGSRNFDISLAFNHTTGMQTFLQDTGSKDKSFSYASKEASNKTKVTTAMDKILEAIAAN